MSNEVWNKWVETSKNVYVADRDAWGRRTHIEIGEYECEICKKTTKIMNIDSSDGEYCSFSCCKPCFENLWSKE